MTISADLNVGIGIDTGLERTTQGELLYELLVFPFPRGHFRVLNFSGEEALSQLFQLNITVVIPHSGAALVEQLALGQRALFVMRAGPVPRVFRGVVAGIQLIENHPVSGTTQYRLKVVPKMWLMKFRRNTRIFQHKRVDQIVDSVLSESGINGRWYLHHTHPARDYCTQYEETDLEFVQRILAEAGIYYHFSEPAQLALEAIAKIDAPSDVAGIVLDSALSTVATGVLDAIFGADTLILGDHAGAYPPLDDGNILGDVAEALGVMPSVSLGVGPLEASVGLASPELYYLNVLGTNETHHDKITRFELARQIQHTSATYREYDPQRPTAVLTSSDGLFKPGQSDLGLELAADLGVHVSPDGVSVAGDADMAMFAGAALGALGIWPDLEHYEHHGPFLFPDWAYGQEEPARIMRQVRRRALITEGDSHVQVMQPGHRFKLTSHPVDRLNRDYTCIKVKHRGSAITRQDIPSYENCFECVPAKVTYCPPRPPRRSVMVALTATVVGPAGEEIYTDALGRIKVQFHWDRQHRRNEQSSCWIRTMQSWGGASWGTQFIPRVGMEVVVTFLGGDPDKPVVMGSIYNGTHPPSFMLPANKTRSGIRTHSSPHAEGFNELSFEDLAGREQVYLKAQRDLDEVVLNDHTLAVSNNETIEVHGNRKDTIDHDVTTHIGDNLKETVMKDHESAVMGSRLDTVTKDRDNRTSGNLTTRIEGREFRDVSKDSNINYEDDFTMQVKGNHTTIVGRHEAPRTYAVHVEGPAAIHATETLQLTSDKEVLIMVGNSSIRLSNDKVEINAPGIHSAGEGGKMMLNDAGLKMVTKGAVTQMTSNGMVTETEKGASFSMGQQVKVDAQKILLNSPDQATDEPPPPPAPPTRLSLVDEKGQPLANQRYVIVLEDGSEYSGRLDKDGKIDIELPEDGEIFFPELTTVEGG